MADFHENCCRYLCDEVTESAYFLNLQLSREQRLSRQEIPRLLLNQKVYCRFHRSSPLDTVLTQINPVHITTLTRIDIVLVYTSGSPKWSLTLQSDYSVINRHLFIFYLGGQSLVVSVYMRIRPL